MVSWWRGLALVVLCAAAWAGCGGKSDHSVGSVDPRAGGPGVGQGGSGNAGTGGNRDVGTGGEDSSGRPGTVVGGGSGGDAGRGDDGPGGTLVQGGAGGSRTPAGGTGGAAAGAGTLSSGGTDAAPGTWACLMSSYADGKCDCGCGAPDPDCENGDIEQCEVCNTRGSCSGAECPARIDPEDTARCLSLPSNWTCGAAAYADGKNCDCGCGAQDPDCGGDTVESCDRCDQAGSCSRGACPGTLDPDDNRVCRLGHGWSCGADSYGDGFCDCGCGLHDIDCPDSSSAVCQFCACALGGCVEGAIIEDNNALCATPPDGWTCPARLYYDGARCDCGCGAIDPDCDLLELSACDTCDVQGSCSAQACPGTINPDNVAECVQLDPPPEWKCYPSFYADGAGCDCGCGAVDPDCQSTDIADCTSCDPCSSRGNCLEVIDPNDLTHCVPAPAGWTCEPDRFSDRICDCGCGVADADCGTTEATFCEACPAEGCAHSNCSHIRPADNSQCDILVPAAWTCDPSFYADGAVCDCGCAVTDLDCASADRSECAVCNPPGSCSPGACPGTITSANNSACASGFNPGR